MIAHVAGPEDETAAVIHRDPDETAAALDRDHPGDGESWLKLHQQWMRVRDPLLEALFTPFPRCARAPSSSGALARTTRWNWRASPLHR